MTGLHCVMSAFEIKAGNYLSSPSSVHVKRLTNGDCGEASADLRWRRGRSLLVGPEYGVGGYFLRRKEA